MRGEFAIFAVLCLVSGNFGKKGFGPGEQEWGFVKVRPYANMFWWLYYTTANVTSYYERPLLIWLQGGPGASSTSFGNFEELGPLDVNLNPRNYTWVKNYNVLFIDNPVGTGFSYVELPSAYTKTNRQIADDLVTCIKEFYKQLPKFQDVPTYILTESYGGKMGAEFALLWYKAQQSGTIKSNLKGVGLGDAWISPVDSVLTWAPYLLQTGMVDTEGYKAIDDAAQQTKKMVESGQWNKATELWGYTESVIDDRTHGVDFYNILTPQRHFLGKIVFSLDPESGYQNFGKFLQSDDLPKLMNGPVKKALGVNSTHGKQSDAVFTNLQNDFMKPVTNIVDQLLNETSLKVFVITGHLDLIVDTPGTLLWVEKLKWKDIDAWKDSLRHPLVDKSSQMIEGYSKTRGNFGFYWVNRAGHMVPMDNPAAMAVILKELTSNAK